MELYHGRPGPIDFTLLVHSLPDNVFQQLTRSTLPLLEYWREPEQRLRQLCSNLGFAPGGPWKACFEYPVPSVGRNKASFTDLMLLGPEAAIAIEGKWTEPEDKATVASWLKKKRHSQNATNVLHHWLKLITSEATLDLSLFDDVVYQLVHRTASVYSVCTQRRAVILQVFKDVRSRNVDYPRMLRTLASAIADAATVIVGLMLVPLETTAAFRRAQRDLEAVDKTDRHLTIRQALLRGGLFAFGEPNFTSFSKPARER